MDLTQLGLKGNSKEIEINKVLEGMVNPLSFPSVREWNDRNHNPYFEKEGWELKLYAIDAIMEAFGVEKLVADETNKTIALYVNLGETYDATILYDLEEEDFIVTSWGEFYQEWQADNIIDVDINDVANEIHTISHLSSIDWDEQKEEEEDEPYIDVRLQVTEDNGYHVHFGPSDNDQDHYGAWGASSVGAKVSMDDAKAIAKDLFEQAADSAACGSLEKEIRSYNDD